MSGGSREIGGEDNDLRFGRSMFTGAFATTLVGLTQLLGTEHLDLPLIVSIYCFAFLHASPGDGDLYNYLQGLQQTGRDIRVHGLNICRL